MIPKYIVREQKFKTELSGVHHAQVVVQDQDNAGRHQ